MNITMLGTTGSGKTAYMAGINEAFVNKSTNDISLRPSMELREALASIAELRNLGFIREGKLGFPTPTTETVVFPFNLHYREQRICKFDWIDYKGGFIDTLFQDDPSKAEIVFAHMLDSDALMIFIDSIKLAKIANIGQCRYATGASSMSIILHEFATQYPDYNKAVTILLTKCDSDLIDQRYKENDYAGLIEKGKLVVDDIIRLAQEKQWKCGMLPVSAVGEKNTKSTLKVVEDPLVPFDVACNITGYPEPLNVDTALLYSILQILRMFQQLRQADLVDLKARYIEALGRNKFYLNFWATVTGKDRPQDVVTRLIEAKQQEQDTLSQLTGNIRVLEALTRGKVRDL